MTDNEMRIAIAEACGWKFFCVNSLNQHVYHGPNGKVAALEETDPNHALPDYLNDLNAIAKAKQTLTDDEREQYPFELLSILGIDCDEPCTPRELFIALSATAKQEAKAFLKTKGIWKD